MLDLLLYHIDKIIGLFLTIIVSILIAVGLFFVMFAFKKDENEKYHAQLSKKREKEKRGDEMFIEKSINENKENQDHVKTSETSSKSIVSQFFSFRILITFGAMKFIYFVGMIFITLTGILMVINEDSEVEVYGIGVLIVGNLLWRIFCEAWILFFSMHDILGSIEKKMGK